MKKQLLKLPLTLAFTIVSLFVKAQTVPTPDHVVIVIMENRSYSDIIGNSNAPYINALASNPATALFTQSFALTHPSQPNYLMLYSGSNQGITSDTISSLTPFSTCNLGASLIAKGKTFAGYSESMPATGYMGATSGNYARKHNPWSNWQGTGLNNIPTSANKTYTSFPADSTGYSALPTVAFVIPNLADDMHNPTGNPTLALANGDTWLSNKIADYVKWCKTHSSLLILTWDEDDNSSSNQITTMVVGENVVGGMYSESIDHYRVLRTLEEMYGITNYCGGSAMAAPITDCWKLNSGIADVNFKKADCTIWPNPAKESLNVNVFWDKEDGVTIEIYDLSGRLIKQQSTLFHAGNNKFIMELEQIKAGVYMLCMSGKAAIIHKKLIIQNQFFFIPSSRKKSICSGYLFFSFVVFFREQSFLRH